MELHNKKVLVCGMALSGVSAARLLRRLGADVTIQDIKEDDKYKERAERLAKEGFSVCLGKNPDDIIAQQTLLVLSPGIPTDLPFLTKAQALDIPILGEIELAFQFCPCPVIAITGTNGKTTTTALTGAIFNACGQKTEIVGNIGIPFSDRIETLTHEHTVIAEMSSFQLETIDTFHPRISAILNITPDHLNRHKTMEQYVHAKAKIFKNQNSEDKLILNFDDPYCRQLAEKTQAQVVFFSRKTPLHEGIYLDGNWLCMHFLGQIRKLVSVDQLQILGNHNIENAMAAIAMAISAKMPVETVIDALKQFQGVEHRIEFVQEVDKIAFYNDSKATNPEAAIKSIEAIQRPIILIGGGYDKGSDFGDWVKSFTGRVKFLIVMGDATNKIIETCKAYNFHNYDQVHSLKDAVMLAKGKANPGDCVLLSPACASWDMFDSFEQRGNLFKKFVKSG